MPAPIFSNYPDFASYQAALDAWNDHIATYNRDEVNGTHQAQQANATTISDGYSSASALLQDVLRQYGLDSLTTWATDQIKQGRSSNEVLISLRQQDAYKQRFAGNEERRAAGLNPISEAEYISYENTLRDSMRRAGVPDQFINDPTLATDLIGKNISAAEVNDRLVNSYAQVAAAAPEVRNAFGEYFGAQGDGALAAFFLDPNRAAPALERMVQEAQIAGIGKRVANVGLQEQTANRLASIGVTQSQAEQGFGNVNALMGLTQETAGETKDLTQNDLINAQFSLDSNATKVLQDRLQARSAAFGADGGAAATGKGVIGLGSSKQ